jgi:putative addiction module component (TIGR02574 family)
MNGRATHLLEEALGLPEEDRGDLAARLIESLEGAEEGDVNSAWAEEIRVRLAELDSGAVQGIPWSEARKKIMEDNDDSDKR